MSVQCVFDSSRLLATRAVALLLFALSLGSPADVTAFQPPAWGQLPPPPTNGLHVRDALRDREIFFDAGGLLALSDTPAMPWQRLWNGTNPAAADRDFAFYDPARDRIWTVGQILTDTLRVWWMDLGADTLRWTPQPITWSGGSPGDTVVQDRGFVFDPVRDRVLSFGGFATRVPCPHCVPIGAVDWLYSLTLAGTPHIERVPFDGSGPSGRLDAVLVHDPWRDRVLMFGGVVPQGISAVFSDETWALSLGSPLTWTLLNPTNLPPSGRSPGPTVLDSLARRWIISGAVSGGGGASTYALDLSSGISALDATWSSLAEPPVSTNSGALFEQRALGRIGYFDGNWLMTLPSGPAAVWTSVAQPVVNRIDLVSFVDEARQRVYAGLGPDNAMQWRPLAQDIPWTTTGGVGPGARFGAAVAVDVTGDRVLVFGGRDGLFSNSAGQSAELWSFDLATTNWALLAPASPPLPRSDALGVFDPTHRRFIIHGGRYNNPGTTVLADTRIYDAVAGTWSSPAAGTYGNRFGEVGIYDPIRDRVIAFGGDVVLGGGINDVHVLPLGATVGTWSALATTGTPPSWSGPSSDLSAQTLGAFYDPLGDRMIVMAGSGPYTQLWQLSLDAQPTWEPLGVTGPLPAQRAGSGLVYDTARNRALLVGGTPTSQAEIPGALWALTFDAATTATEWSLASADATPDQVTLRWFSSSRTDAGRVYRRDSGQDWQFLGEPVADGLGYWTWADRDIVSGTSYDYRLGVLRAGTERFFGETHVEVPLAASFALAGLQPNPSDGPLRVSFTLPNDAPATLELLDVAGRRMLSRDVGAQGAGAHVARLDSDGVRPPSGLYFVRLRQAGQERHMRIIIAR